MFLCLLTIRIMVSKQKNLYFFFFTSSCFTLLPFYFHCYISLILLSKFTPGIPILFLTFLAAFLSVITSVFHIDPLPHVLNLLTTNVTFPLPSSTFSLSLHSLLSIYFLATYSSPFFSPPPPPPPSPSLLTIHPTSLSSLPTSLLISHLTFSHTFTLNSTTLTHLPFH